MSGERARRLAVPQGYHIPELEGFGGAHATLIGPVTVRTLYVDTADLRLMRWGATLCHRDGSWTVSLPGSEVGGDLPRDERTFEGRPTMPPSEAIELVSAFARGAQLRPLVRLLTVRASVRLDRVGDQAVVVSHDLVKVLQGSRVAGRFEEVMVEGSQAVPTGTRRALFGLLGGAALTEPRLVRALALLGREIPAPEVLPSSSGPPSTRAVADALAGAVDRLFRHDAGVRIGEAPEAVHQARVAVRRLRSDLRSFGAVMDPGPIAHLTEELAWLGGALGSMRDLDVVADRFAAEGGSVPAEAAAGLAQIIEAVSNRREAARDALLEAIGSDRYLRLLDDLVALAAEPPLVVRRRLSASGVMSDPWRRLARAVSRAGDRPSDADLHRIRIRTKRVRYAAEAIRPLVGPRATSFARAAARLQDVLGQHHDAVFGGEQLDGLAATLGPDSTYALGWLAAGCARGREAARAAWRDEWRSLARKKRRFW